MNKTNTNNHEQKIIFIVHGGKYEKCFNRAEAAARVNALTGVGVSRAFSVIKYRFSRGGCAANFGDVRVVKSTERSPWRGAAYHTNRPETTKERQRRLRAGYESDAETVTFRGAYARLTGRRMAWEACYAS